MVGKIKSALSFVSRQSKLIFGVVVGLVVGAVGVRVAMAAIPDTAGVIHACYRSGGQVRIIDSPSQSCNGNETATSWNSATPGQFVTNLVGADFTNASLPYRNFVGSDLHNSKLVGAIINGSNFSNADLHGTDLNSAQLNHTSFVSADLSGSNFDASQPNDTDFHNANLSNATLGSTFILHGGSLSGATLTSTSFSIGNIFDNVNFIGDNFTSITILGTGGEISFGSSNLTNANFSGLTLNSFNFSNATASQANFSNVHFIDSYLVNVNLSTANLTGTTWSNTVCPDSTNSDSHANTCLGHLVP